MSVNSSSLSVSLLFAYYYLHTYLLTHSTAVERPAHRYDKPFLLVGWPPNQRAVLRPQVSIPSISFIEPCPRPAGRTVSHTERSATACRSELSLPTLLPVANQHLHSNNVLKFSQPRSQQATYPHSPYTLTYILCTHTYIHPPMPGVRDLPRSCIQTEEVAMWCDNRAADDEFRVPKRKRETKNRTDRLNKEEPLA